MKRILVLLLALLAFSAVAQAQVNTNVTTVPKNYPYGPLVALGSWCTPPDATSPYTSHQFTYLFPSGAPNAVTLTVTGSTNGSTFSSVTTGTTTTGGSISISGLYTGLCITATTMTGSGVTVSGTYAGVPLAGTATVDTTGLASSTNQTSGGQKSQICDAGGDCTTVTGSKLDVNAAIDTTGLATSAKQPALGTAGTASSDVITVQGVASMTKLLVTPDLPAGASTAAKQPALGTAGTASSDVITIQGIASMTKLLVTPDSVALPANQSVNVAQINGVTPLMGNGASGTGAPRVTIANDSTGILAQVTLVPTVTTVGTVTTLTGTTTLTPGTGATNLGKAIDNAVGATDTGVAALAMRKDTPATITPADGDYTQLRVDSLGRLWMNCGTGCSGGTQYNVDVAAGASDTGTLALAVRDDALTTLTPVDGDYVQLRTNSTGALWVQSSIIDAAIGAALATNPVPMGCHNETSPTAIANTQAGVPECDTSQRLILVGAGTAGTAAGGVVTVQGVASMTPILATLSGTNNINTVTTVSTVTAVTSLNQLGGVALPIEDAAETAGGVGIYAMSVRRDTAASSAGTTGDNATINTDAVGALWTNIATVSTLGVYVEDAAETAGGNLMMAGSVRRDTPAASSGTTGDNSTINTNADGALWVTSLPNTTGGWSSINATAADGATACTNSAQAIKASQGTFGGYWFNNPNTTDEWVHIYNVASGSVTVGTTNPQLSFRLPGTAANSVGANVEISRGIQFSTAMSFACTATAGGNGAPANALELDLYYK